MKDLPQKSSNYLPLAPQVLAMFLANITILVMFLSRFYFGLSFKIMGD